MTELLFYAMLAFFFAHELDAVKRHEWRVLPLVRVLPEKTGEQFFIWAHVPLFAAILYFGVADPVSVFSILLSAFAVIHVWLHWIFRNHPAYEFNNPSSWALIVGASFFGAAHVASVFIR